MTSRVLYNGARASNPAYPHLIHIARGDGASWTGPIAYCNTTLTRTSHTNDAPNCLRCIGIRFLWGQWWWNDEGEFEDVEV